MNTLTDTGWITKGKKVVTWTDRHGSTRWKTQNVRVERIERVNKNTFTTSSGDRYKLDTATYRGAGSWPLTHYCRAFESEEGQAALAEKKLRSAEERVHVSYEAWRRDPNEETLLALIDAAQSVPRGTE